MVVCGERFGVGVFRLKGCIDTGEMTSDTVGTCGLSFIALGNE